MFGPGDVGVARVMAQEALLLHRELGDVPGQTVLNPLPLLALRQGDLEAARRYAAESLELAAGTGWEAASLSPWVEVLIASGSLDQAQTAAERQLLRALDAGLENHFRMAPRNLALLAVGAGRPTGPLFCWAVRGPTCPATAWFPRSMPRFSRPAGRPSVPTQRRRPRTGGGP